ncbi:farnesyl-diphosphate synthase [Armillaria nabsnona]|nr:farnesyl-diphosphate synthase [Armillaria nabsnona]
MSTDKAARRKVIKQELLDYITGEGTPKDAIEWYERLNRGMSVVDTAEIIKGTPLTDDEYLKAAVLGWGIELLQAFFLVSDDMMDSSITRRGQPSWYRVSKVGQIAINDSFMLEAAIYYLLKKHFRGESYYVDILELFLEATFQTEMGQLIDLITAPEDEVDLSKHSLIVIYKTPYYSFCLPVALAMYMSHPYALAKSILIPLGEYFQIQDDFLDFSGKLARISSITSAHGRKDSECERRVKEVFESPEVDLRKRYGVYGELVEGKNTLKKEVFKSFIDKIYKRTKQ